MRKPRDFNAELKALDDKARQLKERRLRQLGELVIACGADSLSPEQLAGALLSLKNADVNTMEGWRERGAAFFQRATVKPTRSVDHERGSLRPLDGGRPPA